MTSYVPLPQNMLSGRVRFLVQVAHKVGMFLESVIVMLYSVSKSISVCVASKLWMVNKCELCSSSQSGWCRLKSPAQIIFVVLISLRFCVSSSNVSHIACKLSEWLPSLYILKIVIGPDAVLMETETTSWDLTLIFCHVLDRMHLLINIADHDFLWLLQWSFGSRGYHFWLAWVLPRKSM